MTLDRFVRWRLPVLAGLSMVVALGVVIAILLLGKAPTAFDGSPSPQPSAPSTSSSAALGSTPEAAVRAFFDAFADAGETNDPEILEPFVSGTDSSAYQTAAGFLGGQQAAGKASITTVNELSDFEVSIAGDRATVLFTYRAGGYDIDLETGRPLESPVILPTERVEAITVRVDGRWLLDSYEAVP